MCVGKFGLVYVMSQVIKKIVIKRRVHPKGL